MSYKIYTRKPSAYEKKLKEARRERRAAKRQQTLPVPDLPTAEQVEERYDTALASMNAHVRVILEKDHPEALPLMGATMFLTLRRFSESGMADTLREAMRDCEEELEELFWVFLLSFVADPV